MHDRWDIRTFLHAFDEHLVSCRRVLVQGDAKAIDFNNLSLFLRLQTYYDAVGRINLQISSLFHNVFVLVYIAVLR